MKIFPACFEPLTNHMMVNNKGGQSATSAITEFALFRDIAKVALRTNVFKNLLELIVQRIHIFCLKAQFYTLN